MLIPPPKVFAVAPLLVAAADAVRDGFRLEYILSSAILTVLLAMWRDLARLKERFNHTPTRKEVTDEIALSRTEMRNELARKMRARQ